MTTRSRRPQRWQGRAVAGLASVLIAGNAGAGAGAPGDAGTALARAIASGGGASLGGAAYWACYAGEVVNPGQSLEALPPFSPHHRSTCGGADGTSTAADNLLRIQGGSIFHTRAVWRDGSGRQVDLLQRLETPLVAPPTALETSRYDLSPALALRGTVSTGFRAPSLAESFYSATTVAPTSAFVQLPANSAAAKLLGFTNLRPERSTNYSVGMVLRPRRGVSITVDAYQIEVRDRILSTGSIFGKGGATNFPAVTQAIIENGNVLDSTVAQTGINIFTNGADTRTRGIDLTAALTSDLGDWGRVGWTLAGTYNVTRATRIVRAPAQLTPAGATTPIALFDQGAISFLETASPKAKVVASADWVLRDFKTTVRGTLYGPSSAFYSPNGETFYRQTVPTAVTVDLDVGYTFARRFTLSVGASNLLDRKPPTTSIVPGSTGFVPVNGGAVIDAPLTFAPYGLNGGYYYGRIAVRL